MQNRASSALSTVMKWRVVFILLFVGLILSYIEYKKISDNNDRAIWAGKELQIVNLIAGLDADITSADISMSFACNASFPEPDCEDRKAKYHAAVAKKAEAVKYKAEVFDPVKYNSESYTGFFKSIIALPQRWLTISIIATFLLAAASAIRTYRRSLQEDD